MRTASAIWSPTVSTGLSEVIGSWKIIAMRLPRMRAHLGFVELEEVAALEAHAAADGARGRGGSSRMIDSAVTLLPQPDSPTMPSVSPAWTSNDTPSTARTMPSR